MSVTQKDVKLDEYEEEIIEAFENRKLKPNDSHIDFQAIARNTLKKTSVKPGRPKNKYKDFRE